MDTTNQRFSWKRYAAALRKEWVEKRVMFLLCIAAMLIYFLLLFCPNKPGDIERMQQFFAIVYGFAFFSAIVPSLAFSQLKSKTGKIELFSLPNSMVEKYAVRVTIYIIGFMLAFAACVQLADLVRYAFFNQNGAPDILERSLKMAWGTKSLLWGPYGHEKYYSNWTGCIYGAPIFLLGSVLWPRWSVLKSLVVTIVVVLIEKFGFYFLIGSLYGDNLDLDTIEYNQHYIAMDEVLNIILVLGSLVLAWYLFKRKDIVSLKWWQ